MELFYASPDFNFCLGKFFEKGKFETVERVWLTSKGKVNVRMHSLAETSKCGHAEVVVTI